MRSFLLALLLFPIYCFSQDPSYNPDYNGDGCYDVADLLGFLPLFGVCPPPDTVYWVPAEDVDYFGHTYPVVQIESQLWFTQNLRTEYFTNGVLIPTAVGDDWGDLASAGQTVYGTDGVYCNDTYGDPTIDACDESLALEAYGRLYNWYAVDDVRGLCPAGWRVPSDADFFELEIVLGMPLDELYTFGQNRGNAEGLGTMLKDDGGHWRGSGDGTNDFNFSLVPGSYCHYYVGDFNYSGWENYLWTSSLFEDGTENKAIRRMVNYVNPSGIRRNESEFTYGYSVRCMKDVE